MQVHLVLILICLYINFVQIIFVTTITVRIGRFKVSRRNQKLKQCGSKLLSKEEFSGFVRVNETTGLCEELTGPWDKRKFESGYEYAKISYKKEDSSPPIILTHPDTLHLRCPVVYTPGTSYSLFVTWPKVVWDEITLHVNADDNINNYFVGITERGKYYYIQEPYRNAKQVFYEDEMKGTKCKITFTATGNNTIQHRVQSRKFRFDQMLLGDGTEYDQQMKSTLREVQAL